MPYSGFNKTWAEEIAEISTQREYQTADIRIIDPELIERDYNEDTAQWTVLGDGEIYCGRARIIGVRWGVESGGESQANATTISSIRIQVPHEAVGRVHKSCRVYVTCSVGNTTLTQALFTVTSDIQGSSSAARTFEAAYDADVKLP